jgi:hypothetical protein
MFGSVSFRTTTAEFVRGNPAIEEVTVIEMVAELSEAIVPRLHVTTPADCEQVPWLEDADMKAPLVGRTFVTKTPVEADGPGFRIASV